MAYFNGMLLDKPFVMAVVGVSFHQKEVAAAYQGEPVELIHKPSADFPEAIEVRGADGRALGHVPKALAARITSEYPGILLYGTIGEILNGETIGLRINVLPKGTSVATKLQAAQPPRQTSPTQQPPASQPALANDGKQVKANSGRVVGTLIREEDGKVIVNHNGHEVAYPATLVSY